MAELKPLRQGQGKPGLPGFSTVHRRGRIEANVYRNHRVWFVRSPRFTAVAELKRPGGRPPRETVWSSPRFTAVAELKLACRQSDTTGGRRSPRFTAVAELKLLHEFVGAGVGVGSPRFTAVAELKRSPAFT